uniref:Uncharacterized protein n=1 Tax=Rhizophora mucronata TaxID=61149 RepID=A0A2P2ND40_RHIMU
MFCFCIPVLFYYSHDLCIVTSGTKF